MKTMKKTAVKRNEGSALGAVLLLVVISIIFGTAGLAIGTRDFRTLAVESDDYRAFWAAESGVEQMKAMLNEGARRLGTKGLPAPGSELTWDMGTGGSVTMIPTLDETEYVMGYGIPTYTLTSTGTSDDSEYIISTKMQVVPISRYGVVLGGGGVIFTGADVLGGDLFMHAMITMGTGWGLPKFHGETYSTSEAYKKDSKYYSVDEGAVVENIFLKGLWLDQDPLEFMDSLFASEQIDELKSEAQNDPKGLYLNGDYEIAFKADGSFTATKGLLKRKDEYVNGESLSTKYWEPTAAPTIYQVEDKDIIYVDGVSMVGGVIDGHATVVSPDKTYVRRDGLNYESAPTGDKPIFDWTSEEIWGIDDSFGLVAKNYIYTCGTETSQFHGAMLALVKGVTPIQKNSDLRVSGVKPKMTVFGTVAEKTMLATEGGLKTGFGVDWHGDPRFLEVAPPGFPPAGYKFYAWTRE